MHNGNNVVGIVTFVAQYGLILENTLSKCCSITYCLSLIYNVRMWSNLLSSPPAFKGFDHKTIKVYNPLNFYLLFINQQPTFFCNCNYILCTYKCYVIFFFLKHFVMLYLLLNPLYWSAKTLGKFFSIQATHILKSYRQNL